MSYAALYQYCQTAPVDITDPADTSKSTHVSRKYLLPKILELTGRQTVRFFKVDIASEELTGYIVFPGNTEHKLAKHCNGAPIIAVARTLNYCWSRFAVIKELMHLFDAPLEQVNTADEFESLIGEFVVPIPSRSLAMNCEIKAFWMALGVVCPETVRQDLQRQRELGKKTDLQIAQLLKIPTAYIPSLFDAHFKPNMSSILQMCS